VKIFKEKKPKSENFQGEILSENKNKNKTNNLINLE